MHLNRLRTCHRKDPIGIGNDVYFSWILESSQRNTVQSAFRIQIECGCANVFDSGKIESDQQSFAPCGAFLQGGKEYTWFVTVWDNYGNTATAQASFETAIERWSASWIKSCVELPIVSQPPFWNTGGSTLFRKVFTVCGAVKRARLYATAYGIYHAYINDTRPDDREFSPEHTVYEHILYYQTYPVEQLLHDGENVAVFEVADGWYHCPQTRQAYSEYREQHAILFQLEIEYCDGRKQTVCSDEETFCAAGNVVWSDIFLGEKQDLTVHNEFRKNAVSADIPMQNLCPQPMEPVRPIMELPAKEVYRSPKGEWIADFGQIICGRAKIFADLPRGAELVLDFFEIPDREGNYRNTMIAPQKEIFVSNGTPATYQSKFTFHGFRYARVSGIAAPNASDFTAVVLTTEKENAGRFICSDQRINRLYENIRRSQQNNMLSVPTDCPTREKAGFTGDIQIYAKTAMYNEQMIPFLSSWLCNLEKAQAANGAVPITVPETAPYIGLMKKNAADFGTQYPVGVAGWSDAAVLVPYDMYQITGNKNLLQRRYPCIKAWCDYVIKAAKGGLWEEGFHFGEWLIPSKPHNLTHRQACEDSAFYTAPIFGYISVSRTAEIAEILGEPQVSCYREIAANMKTQIGQKLITEEGVMTTDNMGAYVLMLAFDLVPQQNIKQFENKLVSLLERNGGCLDTGFLATPYILDAFTKIGRKDLAISLLMQNKCPSWLYQVEQGATAIWESWDAIVDGEEPHITSYDHYAFGCVDSWIFENIVGIRLLEPGFRCVSISPTQSGMPFDWFERSFESEYGTIEVFCHANGTLKVRIPCGVTAQIYWKDTCHTVGSGEYEFG